VAGHAQIPSHEIDPLLADVPILVIEDSMQDPLPELALIGAVQKPIQVSAAEFAKRLRTSPITASRRLKELEDGGLIARMLSGRSKLSSLPRKGPTR
jgi:CTP-dependent riboflavin kinase